MASAVLFGVVSCRIVPCRVQPCRVVSCPAVPCRIVVLHYVALYIKPYTLEGHHQFINFLFPLSLIPFCPKILSAWVKGRKTTLIVSHHIPFSSLQPHSDHTIKSRLIELQHLLGLKIRHHVSTIRDLGGAIQPHVFVFPVRHVFLQRARNTAISQPIKLPHRTPGNSPLADRSSWSFENIWALGDLEPWVLLEDHRVR